MPNLVAALGVSAETFNLTSSSSSSSSSAASSFPATSTIQHVFWQVFFTMVFIILLEGVSWVNKPQGLEWVYKGNKLIEAELRGEGDVEVIKRENGEE
jgi:bacteriorhodopsin